MSDRQQENSDAVEEDYIAPSEKASEGEPAGLPVAEQIDRGSHKKLDPLNKRVRNAWRELRGKKVELPSREDLEKERYSSKTARQNHYATALMVALFLQLGMINGFMWKLAAQNNWDVDSAIIVAFLTSVVAEIIGLVFAVVKGTFDRGDEG